MNVKPNAYKIILVISHGPLTRFNNKALAHGHSNAQRMAYAVIENNWDWYLPFDRTLSASCTPAIYNVMWVHVLLPQCRKSHIESVQYNSAVTECIHPVSQAEPIILPCILQELTRKWRRQQCLENNASTRFFNRVYTFTAFSCVLLCQKNCGVWLVYNGWFNHVPFLWFTHDYKNRVTVLNLLLN